MLRQSHCLHAAHSGQFLTGKAEHLGPGSEDISRTAACKESAVSHTGCGDLNCNITHAPGARRSACFSMQCKESSERADVLSGGAAGEWAAGMRSGLGTYWYPGGDIYQGDWRAGRRQGEGSQHCAALEAQYIGEWCA